ncbi:heme peroxidase [Chytriomyces sp. MP71]|nr:heme peroxidase [Chytriomyces sp. MP71]
MVIIRLNFAQHLITIVTACKSMQDMLGSFVLLVALLQTCKSAVIEDIQTFNGEGNNIQHPQWGAVGDVYLRMATPAYGPNQAPAGSSRPNARLVSSMLFGQKPFNQNNGRISDFLAAWGLNTHLDITFAAKNTSDPFPIQVPSGDPDFDPMGTNKSVIPMYRAAYAGVDVTNNARISKNSFTSFIDGSGLYGNSDSEAASMRAFTGGLLKTAYTSTGEYPPRTVGGPMDGYFEFTIGNVNIAPQVLVLHLLFHREHNRRARELAVQSPNWTDEQLYQRARRWVIAILQKITISFAYKGYNLDTNPQVDLFFSQVAFIYGHSALNPEILRINQNGEPIHEGHLELKSASFKFLCDEVIKVGIDPIIRGFIVQRDQIIDTHIIDDVRNNLPLNPGFLFDLAAIGIQRGRDMGIPDWNTCRTMFNLTPITSWADLNNLTDDPESLEILQTLYPNLNDVDAAVGTLAEKISLSNSVVGPLVAVSIRDQFRRLRDGDRFWYENPGVLTASELVELESMSLGRVVTLNTNVSYFPDDPFVILNDSTTYFLEGPLSQITQVLSQPIVNVLDNLRLSWNVSLTDATITFLFETNATGWFAFGFGTSMVQADIYFCNDDGTGAFGVQDSFR